MRRLNGRNVDGGDVGVLQRYLLTAAVPAVVSADVAARSVEQLLQIMRAKRRPFSFGSAGVGNTAQQRLGGRSPVVTKDFVARFQDKVWIMDTGMLSLGACALVDTVGASPLDAGPAPRP